MPRITSSCLVQNIELIVKEKLLMPEINTTSITIVNNISITVPASPQFMTTFILQEQHDWFEDEIKFIRSYIKPGMNIIDIGSNYGLYTLTIASNIGETGAIWAFEPTEFTSSCLEKSISENKFNNITLIKSALSNRLGEAKLYTSPNSEINSLSIKPTPSGEFETISLLTLDQCKDDFKWERIDFIKLDAEGEEVKILEKGEQTLSSLSPLIMYEFKQGKSVNLPLVDCFKNMGYESYRLLPSLNILIPFDHNEPFDGYLLNIFCCKEDKAKQLESEGVIVNSWEEKNVDNESLAHEYITHLPFWGSLHVTLRDNDSSDDYLEILNLYIMSLSEDASSSDRLSYLMSSLLCLKKMLVKGEQRIERLVTFSRILFDAGERTLAVNILSNLINKYSSIMNFEVDELFLPASKQFDYINSGGKLNEWLLSSVYEQSIIKHAFSCYYTKQAALPVFERLNALGFISEDMKNRHRLVKTCFAR